MNNQLFDLKIILRNSDLDMYNNLTPCAVLEFLQDAGGYHAYKLGVDYQTMINKNLIWVITATKFQIVKNPIIEQPVLTVTTWPLSPDRLQFKRNYILKDSNNEVIATGESNWVVLNVNSRRLVRASEVHFDLESFSEESISLAPITKLEPFDYKALPAHIVEVGYSDLDHNFHLNNCKYANYIMNCISLGNDEMLDTFQIEYKKECKEKDILKFYINKKENDYDIMGIRNDEDLSVLAKITTRRKL